MLLRRDRSDPATAPMSNRPWIKHAATLGVVALAVVATAGCSARSTPASSPPSSHGNHLSAPPAAPLRDGERFQTLTMAGAYTPSAPGGGTDEYRCFLVDPGFAELTYLTGSQFLPQNADIVHHAIFFRLNPSDLAAAHKLDTDSPGDGWTCFSGTGIGDGGLQDWVAGWAPGTNETLLAPNLGAPMPAGSQLVMQVHYNLLATNGKPGGSDQSSIRLRVSNKPLSPLLTTLLAAPVELPCAPDESGPLCTRDAAIADVISRFGTDVGTMSPVLDKYCNADGAPNPGPTQHCDIPFPVAGTIYAGAGHMHLLGRSIKVELNPGTDRAKTLLDVPNYNFDDQGLRPLANPVAIAPGDTLRVTCTHDITLRKQLPQLKTLPARYVAWGDGTSDEMCLGIIVWTPTA